MAFSNTNTGSKPSDPYKERNLDEHASLKEKIEDFASFIENCKFGMMTTRISSTGMLASRCMALAAKASPHRGLADSAAQTREFGRVPFKAAADSAQEAGGVDLIFHTNTESGKTDDLTSDPHTNISFLNSSGEWASLSGTAEISTDRSLIKKYYTPSLKAWMGDLGDGKHDGGPEDPRIGVILVKARTIIYAISPSSTIVGRGAQVVKGMVTGQAAQVNKLREMSEEDILQWRKVSETGK